MFEDITIYASNIVNLNCFIFYFSYYNSSLYAPPRPLKRQRLMSSQSRSPVPTKIITANIINTQVLQNPQQQQQYITSHQPSLPSIQQQQQQHQILISTNNAPQNGNKLTNGCITMNGDHQHSNSMNGTNNGIGQTLLGPFKVYSKFYFIYIFEKWQRAVKVESLFVISFFNQ